MTTPNPDRVHKPVTAAAAGGALLAVLAAVGVDGAVDPTERGTLVNALLAFGIAAVPTVLTWWASRRAKGNVTPILPGDQPRNLDGIPLAAGRVQDPGPATHTAAVRRTDRRRRRE